MERTKHQICSVLGNKYLAVFQQPLEREGGGARLKIEKGYMVQMFSVKQFGYPLPVGNCFHKVVVRIITVRNVMHFVHRSEMIN